MRSAKDYDLEQRRLIDAEITRRSVAFIERQAKGGKPFFAYVALTQPHLPTLPNPAFKGKTGNGDWADMLAEMDANVGQMLDAVDRAGVRDNTIVIFTGGASLHWLKREKFRRHTSPSLGGNERPTAARRSQRRNHQRANRVTDSNHRDTADERRRWRRRGW